MEGSERQGGLSLIAELRDLSDAELMPGLDMKVMMKEKQEQKWLLVVKLNAVEASMVGKEMEPFVRDISVVAADDDDDLSPHIAEERRPSQATVDFAPGFRDACKGPKEAVADLERQVSSEATDTQVYGIVGESG